MLDPVEHALRAHDALIGTPDPLDHRLAQLSFVRACVASGLRDVPVRAEEYLRDLVGDAAVAVDVKERAISVWMARELMLGPGRAEPRRLLALLPTRGDLRVGYELACDGLQQACALDFRRGVDELETAVRVFARAGRDEEAAVARRALVHVLYVANDDDRLAAALAAPHAEREDYFRAVLAWQRGREPRVDRLSAPPAPPTPPTPIASAHELLPGPYAQEYLPYCAAAMARAVRGQPPDPEHARVLGEALRRLRFFVPVTACGVALALCCALHGRDDEVAAVVAALRTGSPPQAAHGDAVARLVAYRRDGATADALADVVDRATSPADRLAAPLYVLLAARVAFDHAIDPGPLAELARASPWLRRLTGRPRALIEACARVLTGAGEGEGDELDQLAAGVIAGRPCSSPQEADPLVKAVRDAVDAGWFEQLDFAALARAHGVAPAALTGRFRRAAGVTPAELVRQRRLAEARRLLAATDWDITAIAHECGFYDGAHFSRAFKRRHGVSPTEFRRGWAARRG